MSRELKRQNNRSQDLSNVSLQKLAEQINLLHGKVTALAMRSLEMAKEAGEYLTHAKSQLRHGQWQKWLEENCSVSDRMARNYMQIFSQWDKLAKTEMISALTVTKAIEVLREKEIDVDDFSQDKNRWDDRERLAGALILAESGIDDDAIFAHTGLFSFKLEEFRAPEPLPIVILGPDGERLLEEEKIYRQSVERAIACQVFFVWEAAVSIAIEKGLSDRLVKHLKDKMESHHFLKQWKLMPHNVEMPEESEDKTEEQEYAFEITSEMVWRDAQEAIGVWSEGRYQRSPYGVRRLMTEVNLAEEKGSNPSPMEYHEKMMKEWDRYELYSQTLEADNDGEPEVRSAVD